jgi:molybdopterin synthase catalytic subunit
MKISVQSEDFDLGAECAALARGARTSARWRASSAWCATPTTAAAFRRMTLEHYPGMTEKSLAEIVEQARGRWEVIDATVIHRVGELKPGDNIVLVAVASAHRGDAFAACEFIMDYLKTRAPFWKKEETPEGGRWVDARESDDLAAESCEFSIESWAMRMAASMFLRCNSLNCSILPAMGYLLLLV